MSTKEQILRFKGSAEKIFKDKDYTSSAILYFKTWFAIQDFFLLTELGMSPKDHTERFRILERHYPEDYKKLDKEFSTYRDTYSKMIDKETCERIKEIVEHEIIDKSIIKKSEAIPSEKPNK